MATTEELARRFCELAGWEYRLTDERLFFSPGPGKPGVRGNLHPFPTGWQGIGIVVDEMRRRNFAWSIEGRTDGVLASFYEPDAWDKTRPALGSELALDPLDAVLTAAKGALEAEPEEAR